MYPHTASMSISYLQYHAYYVSECARRPREGGPLGLQVGFQLLLHVVQGVVGPLQTFQDLSSSALNAAQVYMILLYIISYHLRK